MAEGTQSRVNNNERATSSNMKAAVKRRPKGKRTSFQLPYEDRPTSLELETDFTNTETKLVILDFLSNQPAERLRARNAYTTTATAEGADLDGPTSNKAGNRPLGKSSSDGSSHKNYRTRYAKLAKSARPLRKQYSLRLKKDLDEYLRQRGNSWEDLTHTYSSDDGAETPSGTLLHQRSYTEGDQYYTRRRWRKKRLPKDLKRGIVEFDTDDLKHVPDEEKAYDVNRLCVERPEVLELPYDRQRRVSPVLSPESQVAARLEVISQKILDIYPGLFAEQINNEVSLQDLTYEKFAATARKVLEKYPGGWTRIAIVCYFARELALEDQSTDEQLEQLVEFSSRFISETSSDWLASQGGWGALEDTEENLSPSAVRRKLKEDPDIVDGLLNVDSSPWLNYVKYYGFKVAALAVGVSVAYHVARGY